MYSIFIEYFRNINYLNLLQKNTKFDNFTKKKISYVKLHTN